jgi:hypothetical protein
LKADYGGGMGNYFVNLKAKDRLTDRERSVGHRFEATKLLLKILMQKG